MKVSYYEFKLRHPNVKRRYYKRVSKYKNPTWYMWHDNGWRRDNDKDIPQILERHKNDGILIRIGAKWLELLLTMK